MVDTNYISTIVKIVENPIQKVFNERISITKFRVQLPQLRNTRLVHVIFWGTLGRDVAKYYKPNDYILIEGYLSLRDQKKMNLKQKKSKQLTITVLKIYPVSSRG